MRCITLAVCVTLPCSCGERNTRCTPTKRKPERRWTRAVSPRQRCRDVNVCLLGQSWTRESEVSIPRCEVQQLWQDWASQGYVQTT